MNLRSNISNYFRDCYQSDFGAVHLLNFFSAKVEQPLIYEQQELLTGKLVQVAVPTDWAKETERILAIYAKEKSLFLGAFFLVGKTNLLGRKQEVCAPLFLYTINFFEEDEIHYFSLNPNPILNPVFFDTLKNEISDKNLTYETLVNRLPKGFIGYAECGLVEEVLAEYFPKLEITQLAKYPDLLNKNEVSEFRKSVKEVDKFQVITAIGVGLVKHPTGSRGVLNELKSIAEGKEFSWPLKAIFEGKSEKQKTHSKHDFLAPVTLTKAQKNIIESAEKNTLTMAVGPPGTGKSFTIAALAVDFLTQEKSVLIAARNNQAVNVVADKIERDFGLKNVVVRAGRRDYQQLLKKRLKNILHGIGHYPATAWELKKNKGTALKIEKELRLFEKIIIDREKNEIERGALLAHFKNNLWHKWKKYRLGKLLKTEMPYWVLFFEYEKVLKNRHFIVGDLNQMSFDYNLLKTLINSRKDLQNFYSGLKQRQGVIREEVFDQVNFQKVLKAFPIWVVNTADIDKVLPLQKELFDLVIIDESSQCDIASAIPVLQRGRKAAIVGDPKQLRHISFLARAQMQEFVQKNELVDYDFDKLNYRDSSLLDVVSSSIDSQKQVHFLDEHYRSMPEIIAFSNAHFYQNNLRVMTETPLTKREKCVYIHQVGGKRFKRGYNQKEAEAIIEKVKSIIEYERKFEPKLAQSIGILSPFREQVNYLQRKIEKEFSAEDLEKHQILIGTPHAFQGEEKEVMLLSFVVDKNTHPSTFQYLNREDVFNVSITRARSLQQLYLSIEIEDLNPKYLLTKYLRSIDDRIIEEKKNDFQKSLDYFMEDVEEELMEMGFQNIQKDYYLAGLEIDLVVIQNGQIFCIDLVGFPGEFEEAMPVNHWQRLSRIDVPVFMLPYSWWHFQKEKCLRALKKFLSKK